MALCTFSYNCFVIFGVPQRGQIQGRNKNKARIFTPGWQIEYKCQNGKRGITILKQKYSSIKTFPISKSSWLILQNEEKNICSSGGGASTKIPEIMGTKR